MAGQMMTRTTITISEETLERYRREANERRVSMATLMRDVLEGRTTVYRPRPRFGIGASEKGDLSTRSGDERPEPRPWRS